MRISKVRKHVALAALLLVSTACQAGTPQAHSTPRPSASPSATPDAQRCARLAKRGFTPCPPLASQLKLPPTTIKNRTDGAVDDATVQRWGRAFQLGQAYYYWVMEKNARDVLTSDVLADTSATDNLFGNDLADLDEAKKAGGTLVVKPFSTPVTQAVVIPQSLQDVIEAHRYVAKPYGFAVRFQGPANRTIRFPDGREVSRSSNGPDVIVDGVIWGELRSDPDLGDIWYEFGSFSCGEIRSVCQL